MEDKVKDFQPVAAPARAESATYANFFTLVLTIALAANQYFRGIHLDVDLTPTGSGTGTAYVADAIRELRVTNELGEVVLKVDGGSGPGLAAILGHIITGKAAQTVFVKKLAETSTTSYNAWWQILMAAKGDKFTIEVDIDPALLAGITLSALASSMGASILTSDEPGEQVRLSVKKRVSPERITVLKEDPDGIGIAYLLAVTASELGSVISSLSIGGKDYTVEQIRALENITASKMAGLAVAGSEGAVQYVPGLASPNATTQLYAIAVADELPMAFNVVMGSAVTAYLAKVVPSTDVAVI